MALGTLDDSEVRLFDSNGWSLESNDDHGNSPASRIVWEAPDSGDYYAKVEASRSARDGTGSYTLTISLSDIQDDHANDTDSATAVAVGVDTQGTLDYEGDADFFRFTATVGQLYQIDVALGTLDNSVAVLLDSNGWSMESNDDHGNSPASRNLLGGLGLRQLLRHSDSLTWSQGPHGLLHPDRGASVTKPFGSAQGRSA